MNNTKEINKKRLPAIGQRIIKTAAAVFICLLIYILRGYQGLIGESVIAAIICLQPYIKDSKKFALDRVAGTVIGGIWGLLFLLIINEIPAAGSNMLIVYILMAAGIIPVLYSCILIKAADTAALSAIVYLCVIIAYPNVEAPVIQTLNRVLDTTIGVLVAVAVNTFHWPTNKHPERIFFVRLDDLAADRYSQIPAKTLVELNRLYDEGAKICLETLWAPAYLIAQLQMLRLNMPVIVLGGSALYDIRDNTYPLIRDISHQHVEALCAFLKEQDRCGCIFAIRDSSMLIYFTGPRSADEEENFRLMRRSPYRNYMNGHFEAEDHILAIRVFIEDGEADRFEKDIIESGELMENFEIKRYPRPGSRHQTVFYLCRQGVSIDAMEQGLVGLFYAVNEEKLNAYHIFPHSKAYDAERDAHILLHRIRKLYMTPRLPFVKKK